MLKTIVPEVRARLLNQCVTSIAKIVLHVTGDARLAHGELRAAVDLLRTLLRELESKEEP